MGIYDKFYNCYQINIEIGLVKDGEQCQGEFDCSDKIYKECYKCPYLKRWLNGRK